MSDVILGKIIEGEAQRDAIHIAVAPVVAGERLSPGDHVGLDGDGVRVKAQPKPRRRAPPLSSVGSDDLMKSFYEPTQEHLTKLSAPWCASYSGGKDSTSLVTWIEWMRRTGWITVEKPQLVLSDTGVEDVALQEISTDMMNVLRGSGWECAIVEPRTNDKLYVMILGRGITPIHPGVRSMRWCTRSTKIDPMKLWRSEHSDDNGLTLTGLRMNESVMRDGKLKKRGCFAGGECGIPDPGERTYSPIINWSTCQVIDWLSGQVQREVKKTLADLLPMMKRLVDIYECKVDSNVFEFAEPEVSTTRFGCIGCPAIQAERHAPPSVVVRYGPESALLELYDVWFEARRRRNRLYRVRTFKGKPTAGFGPTKMAVRKQLFARVMDIQKRAGIILVTPEDETYIRQCWENKVYPRGWSEADELTQPPDEMPLYPAKDQA